MNTGAAGPAVAPHDTGATIIAEQGAIEDCVHMDYLPDTASLGAHTCRGTASIGLGILSQLQSWHLRPSMAHHRHPFFPVHK